LIRIRDPWSKLITKARGFVLNEHEITTNADAED